ncbi:MAG: DUF4230 domain-containing protein [Spirochaetia bacterium]
MKKCIIILFTLVLFFSCQNQEPEISLSEVRSQVEEILLLPTVEMTYRDVIYFSEEETALFLSLSNRELLFSVNITVNAGFNLTHGVSLNRTESGIVIHLPEPEILSIDADEQSIHEYFSFQRGRQIELSDYYRPIAIGKTEIENDAVSRGILETAQANGERVIREIFTPLNMGELEFSYFEEQEVTP